MRVIQGAGIRRAMRKQLPLLLVCLLSPSAFAGTAKCRIKTAKPGSVFVAFVGGKAVMEFESGQLVVYTAASGEALSLANPESVTSFGARRGACTYGWEKIVNGDQLRLVLMKFNSCVHQDQANPELRGYVRADFGFDLFDGSGHYREIFMTPTGTPPTAHMTFEDCRVVE